MSRQVICHDYRSIPHSLFVEFIISIQQLSIIHNLNGNALRLTPQYINLCMAVLVYTSPIWSFAYVCRRAQTNLAGFKHLFECGLSDLDFTKG